MKRAALVVGAALCASCGSSAVPVPADVGAGATAVVETVAEPASAPVREHVRPAAVRGVLLFVCDTLRADRLSCYGYERQTPGIDRLARLGTLYERHHAQGHWTLPSMISLMTGLYVQTESEAIPADRPTLAEWLSESGVDTAAFVGNNVIGRERGFARGFDEFHIVEDPTTRADELVDQFLVWLTEHERTRPGAPWFVWLHAMDPHAPYTPQPRDARYAHSSSRPGLAQLRPMWLAASPQVAKANAAFPNYLDDSEAVRRMVARSNAYDGEVLSVDRAVARVLERLERNGGLAETAVLFAADHGEMLYEYAEYPAGISSKHDADGLENGLIDWFVCGHENWFYPEQWRTPMIAIAPGFAAGARESGLSANIDIYPTILELLGLERPAVLDGDRLSNSAERAAVFGHGRGTTALLEASGLQLIDFEAGRYGPRARQVLYESSTPHLVDESRDRPADVARLMQTLSTWRAERSFEPNMNVPKITANALRRLGYAPVQEPDSPDSTGGAQHTGGGEERR